MRLKAQTHKNKYSNQRNLSLSLLCTGTLEYQQPQSPPQQQQQIQQQQQSTLAPQWQQQQQEDFNNLNIIGEEYPTSASAIKTPHDDEALNEIISSSAYEESQEDSLICKICQHKYKSATLLKFHMKRHVARTFFCKFCPKTFVTRSDLQRHGAIHDGDLRFKCDLCDKKFGYSHHLKRHRDTIHLGKRFVCATIDCGKVFASKTQLTLHRRNHDGTLPFRCPYCQRVFNRRAYFRQHALKAHNLNLTQAEIAEVYRATTGHCNPHDLLVANEGQFVRRSDIEALAASTAVANIIPIENENFAIKEEIVTEEAVDTYVNIVV